MNQKTRCLVFQLTPDKLFCLLQCHFQAGRTILRETWFKTLKTTLGFVTEAHELQTNTHNQNDIAQNDLPNTNREGNNVENHQNLCLRFVPTYATWFAWTCMASDNGSHSSKNSVIDLLYSKLSLIAFLATSMSQSLACKKCAMYISATKLIQVSTVYTQSEQFSDTQIVVLIRRLLQLSLEFLKRYTLK